MPSPATTWLHVSGYRFLLRRIECALLFGDVCAATGALRARTTSLALGCVLAIVAAMGCAFVALLRPQSALGQAPIVMGRESGALYVRVDDVWHPVLNLASARLIAATNANPQPVSESELGHTKRGPLLGIPGAPQLLDQPLAGAESAWAICDSDNGGSTTVVVGPAEDSSAQVLTAEQMILVATESGSPTYLLYGGRRAVVDLADIGSSVRDVALSPDGAIAYVASCGSDFGAVVDVIDTRTHQITSSRAISEIGGLVTRVSVSGDADRAYLVSEDRVTVLCTRTHDVIGTIRTGQPSCVVESPDGKYLYIADYSGTITRTAVASTIVSGTEQLALQRRGSMQWFSPELQQYAPALA